MKAIVSPNEGEYELEIDVAMCPFCSQRPLITQTMSGWHCGCHNYNDYNMKRSGATEYCGYDLATDGHKTPEEAAHDWNSLAKDDDAVYLSELRCYFYSMMDLLSYIHNKGNHRDKIEKLAHQQGWVGSIADRGSLMEEKYDS